MVRFASSYLVLQKTAEATQVLRATFLVKTIFNTDQDAQFTSKAFTGKLDGAGIKISMDGRGRVFDNIFIERLWRSVKYEEVYIKDYRGVREAVTSLGRYFEFYNNERLHQSLDYKTPAMIYFQ